MQRPFGAALAVLCTAAAVLYLFPDAAIVVTLGLFLLATIAFPRSARHVAWGLVALLLIGGGSVFAADTTVSGDSLLAIVFPYIAAVVAAVISWLVGVVLNVAKNKLHLSVDDSMRDALQTAAKNGAGLVLNKLGNQLQGKTIDVKNELVAIGVKYVLEAAPDAVAHFGLTPDAIAQKIVALLPQIANTTSPSATSA